MITDPSKMRVRTFVQEGSPNQITFNPVVSNDGGNTTIMLTEDHRTVVLNEEELQKVINAIQTQGWREFLVE